MTSFFDKWLGFWEEAQEEKNKTRNVIHEEELEWVETPQDCRVALLAAPENGFRTWGSEYMIAEIPPGWNTGKHEHGEEAIYIVQGEGFSIVNGTKYEWGEGSVLWMPFGSQHQHFNTGTEIVRYFSAMALHIEHFLGLGKLDQLQVKGPTDTYVEVPTSATGFDSLDRRICLRFEDTEEVHHGDITEEGDEGTGEPVPMDVNDPRSVMQRAGHRDFMRIFMDRPGRNGFKNREIEILSIMGEDVGHHGGKHAHMEAVLYVLAGEGYSTMGDEKVPWKKGSLLHVKGPQTPHQHFNTGTGRVEMLRAAPGARFSFMQGIARERFPYLWYSHRGVNKE